MDHDRRSFVNKRGPYTQVLLNRQVKSEPMNVERFGFHISMHGCETDLLISSGIKCGHGTILYNCRYLSILVHLKINWNQTKDFLVLNLEFALFPPARLYFSSVDAPDTHHCCELAMVLSLFSHCPRFFACLRLAGDTYGNWLAIGVVLEVIFPVGD